MAFCSRKKAKYWLQTAFGAIFEIWSHWRPLWHFCPLEAIFAFWTLFCVLEQVSLFESFFCLMQKPFSLCGVALWRRFCHFDLLEAEFLLFLSVAPSSPNLLPARLNCSPSPLARPATPISSPNLLAKPCSHHRMHPLLSVS